MTKNILIFDVEAISLHGYGFAIGALVFTPTVNGSDWSEIDRFELMGPVIGASDWVEKNVLPNLLSMPKTNLLVDLFDGFYNFLQKNKEAQVWVDCGYPVETNFLENCFKSQSKMEQPDRDFKMPYPIYDVSTLVDIEIDRAMNYDGPLILRNHHPIDDCIASFEMLKKKMAYLSQADAKKLNIC